MTIYFVARARVLCVLSVFGLLAACTGAPTAVSETSALQTVEPITTVVAPTVTARAPVPTDTPSRAPTDVPTRAPTDVPARGGAPDADAYEWTLIAHVDELATYVTGAGDGSGRLYVVEQAGVVRVLEDGVVRAEPFLDLRDRVGAQASEQGLLSIAFHPQYAENGYVYVNYTDRDGDTVVARFVADPEAAVAQAASARTLFTVAQPYANHNGGQLQFGPDGLLYIGMGDGGSGGDPEGHAQNPDDLLGKLLRFDVGRPNGAPERWALGLRNPWRFSFDRATGELYIGDVGQGEWEELNVVPADAPAGLNFGWNYREGRHAFEGTVPSGLTLVEPVIEYNHNEGGCSIVGGYVYRGADLPEWQGVYVYGDFCTGQVWGAWRAQDSAWQTRELYDMDFALSSFGQGDAGELYLVDYGGAVYQLMRR